jgi:hypothetical protein
LHELQGAGRASDAPSMENFGQKTLSSHAIQGSDGIAWGSALPRQRGFKGGGGTATSASQVLCSMAK